MRYVHAWFNTFKVKLASEGKTRQLTNEWIGEGLKSEHPPLFVTKGKTLCMVLLIQPGYTCDHLFQYTILEGFFKDLTRKKANIHETRI